MLEPTPIPRPELIDTDRTRFAAVVSHGRPEEQVAQLQRALADATDYGRALWSEVAALRRYLLATVDVDSPVAASRLVSADKVAWDTWMDAYASAGSMLTGPHGDSGLAGQEAKEVAQVARRRIPVMARVQPERPQPPKPATDAPAPAWPLLAAMTLAGFLVRSLLGSASTGARRTAG